MAEKQNNPSVVIKSSLWYTISGFVAKSMGFITTPLYARLLSTEDYGNFHVYANWQIVFAIICGMELASTMNRARFDFKEKKEFDNYVSSCLVLTTIATVLLFTFFMIVPGVFEDILGMSRKYLYYMFIYLLFLPALDIFQTKQMINYNYKLSTVISFTSAVICSSLALGLAYIIDTDRLFGRILGQYMPIAIIGAVLYVVLLKQGHKINKKYWKYALTVSIPLMFSSLAGQILTSSDKVIVQHLNTSDEVAYVGLATTISHIMVIFVGALNSAWAPYFYNKLDLKDYSSIKRGYKLYFGVILFVTLGVLLLGPEVVRILGGSKYYQALYLIPPTAIMGILISVLNQYSFFEVFLKKTKYIAILITIAAAMNVGLDILFVSKFGYISVAYVTVFCYIVLNVLHLIVTKKLGSIEVLPFKMVMLVMGIAVLLMGIGVIIYPYSIIRYIIVIILIVVFLFAIIVKRKALLGILRTWLSSKKNNK